MGLSFHLSFWSALTFTVFPGMPEFVSKLTNLNTLIMDKIYVLRPGDGPMESLSWVPLVLESVTAPIRRLCIELMIKNIDHLDSMDWSKVDRILTNRESFRSLTEVSVSVLPTTAIRRAIDTDALKTFIGQRLPVTSRRGVLSCVVGKS